MPLNDPARGFGCAGLKSSSDRGRQFGRGSIRTLTRFERPGWLSGLKGGFRGDEIGIGPTNTLSFERLADRRFQTTESRVFSQASEQGQGTPNRSSRVLGGPFGIERGELGFGLATSQEIARGPEFLEIFGRWLQGSGYRKGPFKISQRLAEPTRFLCLARRNNEPGHRLGFNPAPARSGDSPGRRQKNGHGQNDD